jgi:peptide/nickel transport system permease protein
VGYIVRRLLLGGVTVLVIALAVVALSNWLPQKVYSAQISRPQQTAAEKQRVLHHYGADRPFVAQYATFLVNLGRPAWTWAACPHGDIDDPSADVTWHLCAPHLPDAPDLGYSVDLHDTVAHAIGIRAPQTLLLMGVSYALQLLVAIPIGVAGAIRQYGKADNALTLLSFVGLSVPTYWLGSILIYALALPHASLPGVGTRPPFPVGGYSTTGTIGLGNIPDLAWHLVLPATVLAVPGIAVYARFTRGSMLEVLRRDYIRTARAKGLSRTRVLLRHALRNALLPLITLAGLELPQMFAGAVITEYVFNWHGMGQLFVAQTQLNDTSAMLGIVVLLSVFVVLGNLLADLVYRRADPRISYGGRVA